MRDPYKILGVQKDAGADEIKAAWRSAAKSSHPDQNREDPDATRKFAELGRAYDVLKDPEKRRRYDDRVLKDGARKGGQTIQQQREAARQAAREHAEKVKAAKENADRLMAEMAKKEAEKAKAAGGAQTQQAQAQQTQGQQAQAQQTQGQAKPGAKKGESPEAVVSRIFGDSAEASAAAEGLRKESDAKVEAVETPGAKQQSQAAGRLDALELIAALLRKFRRGSTQPEKAPDMFAEATVTIDDMLKAGWINLTLPDGREIRFSLEGGFTDGHLLRLAGQGYKITGMQRGDVVVTLRVAKHDRYTLNGHDIHTILPVALENAVLGQKTKVQTPDGEVEIEIPAWSSSDQTIRLEGRGLPDGTGGRGAFILDLRVVLWEKPDAKVTDLMRHMREGLYL